MKKIAYLFLVLLFVLLFFSCATPFNVTSERKGSVGQYEVIPIVEKPENGATGKEKNATADLPKIGISKAEVEKKLIDYSTRMIGLLKNLFEAEAAKSAKAKDGIIAAQRNTAEKKESNKTAEAANNQYVPQPSPLPVSPEPATIPVVTTPVVEPAYTKTDSSSDRVRTIYARIGDEIEISFKENGWLLLEMPAKGSGINFISRSIEEGKTLFKLRGNAIGSYPLPFQYQDQLRGIMRREIIEVKVVGENEFDSAMGSRMSDGEKELRSKKREYAARLYDLGDFKGALREYLAAYSEGDPALNETIATLALKEKDYKNAASFWKKNLRENGAFHDKALLGLVMANIGLKDRSAMIGQIQELFAVDNFPIEEELMALVRFFNESQNDSFGYQLLNEYLAHFPSGAYLDEIYYLLGMLYEQHPTLRDFKKAREYYTRVVKEHPESPYLLRSKERIDYINRHYFRVQ
jgi:tetratricopeptide (TPR) repeat protein